MKRRTTLALLGAGLCAPWPGFANNNNNNAYPQRAIRLVVGFAPGGAADELARSIADRLSTRLKQAVVIENKPGAASTLAADVVGNAPADGYTLLFGTTSMVIARHLQGRASADISRFAPVAAVAVSPLVIAVNPKFPGRTPQSFVREIRDKPAKYFYATSGVGTLQHLGMETLKKQLDLKVDHVPYKGASQLLPDLISGQIPIALLSASAAAEHAAAGKLVVVGLMNEGRWAASPQWPSMSEVAPGSNVMSRMYVLAPAGVPAGIVERLDAEIAAVLGSAELVSAFASQGAVPQHVSARPLQGELQAENAAWSQAVKTLGLKAD